ncbi:MAG: hypothetical protein HZC05_02940 [Candidatus Magasanikbacteria bacterium]|nr:hypothetical protein [Candidatus Magasanikbacteria bacterium]
MEYYHNLITEKSFQLLQQLRRDYHFILIGGWAVFLYTHSLKSKDINIIIDYDELVKLKRKFNVTKNDRLKKYEIKIDGIDIDIYLPFYSELGIPAEEIQKHAKTREGFTVPQIEVLLILKQVAYAGRQGTPKGEKDKIDIFSLLALQEIDWKLYKKLTDAAELRHLPDELKSLLRQTMEIKELNLNQAKMSKLKKEILGSLCN